MAKKKEETVSPPAADAVPVTVRATGNLSEGGVFHAPGSVFETTTERAAALGDLVEVVADFPTE